VPLARGAPLAARRAHFLTRRIFEAALVAFLRDCHANEALVDFARHRSPLLNDGLFALLRGATTVQFAVTQCAVGDEPINGVTPPGGHNGFTGFFVETMQAAVASAHAGRVLVDLPFSLLSCPLPLPHVQPGAPAPPRGRAPAAPPAGDAGGAASGEDGDADDADDGAASAAAVPQSSAWFNGDAESDDDGDVGDDEADGDADADADDEMIDGDASSASSTYAETSVGTMAGGSDHDTAADGDADDDDTDDEMNDGYASGTSTTSSSAPPPPGSRAAAISTRCAFPSRRSTCWRST
jgi:hypothetical protein